METNYLIPNYKVWDFYGFVMGVENHRENLYSMEQLWLMFVMKEKYNKEWNGKDWEAKSE